MKLDQLPLSSVSTEGPYTSLQFVKLRNPAALGDLNMDLLRRFEQFYSDFKTADLAKLDDLYAPGVQFRDPVREIVGIAELRRYFSASREHVAECGFDFVNRLSDDGQCFFQWRMHYRHPRLAGGKPLFLRGMSHIHFFEDRILEHSDIYDMGAMLYEHVPVLRTGVRLLKQRLED